MKPIRLDPKKVATPAIKLLYNLFRYAFLIGISYMALFPVLRLLFTSVTHPDEILAGSTQFLPNDPTFGNYKYALSYFDYTKYALITLYTAGISTVLQCAICSIVGYGLGRYKFKGRALVFGAMLFTIVMPLQTVQIPLTNTLKHFDFFGLGKIIGLFGIPGVDGEVSLLENYMNFFVPALFGVGLRSGIFIFLFQQFFAGMPRDLEDAAKIDGCSPWKCYLKVMLPNITPVLVTVALLSMVYYWNDSFLASMTANRTNAPMMNAIELAVWTVDAFTNQADAAARSTSIYALMLMGVLPLMLLFTFCQKYFVESMDRSGIKG